jgi:UDP-N-acetylmuramate dehydrogenase
MPAMQIQENIPLAPLTTFKIGGPARYFADVRTENEIREAFEFSHVQEVPFLAISGGSNLLVPDDGLNAVVVRLVGNLYSAGRGTADAWAGTNLLTLINAMAVKGRGGWERLAGIPGSIGGAVRGNAGAFGSELKDFVQTVRALNIKTGETRDFSNAECTFSYRMSFFKEHSQWLVLRVVASLTKTDPVESAARIEETIQERHKRHIQDVQAAGSYFINPVVSKELQEAFEKEKGTKAREGRVPAGWLIENAGFKGARVGGAVASEQHPNYLKNDGGATAAQVKELAQKIKKAVREKYGVELKEEAVVL